MKKIIVLILLSFASISFANMNCDVYCLAATPKTQQIISRYQAHKLNINDLQILNSVLTQVELVFDISTSEQLKKITEQCQASLGTNDVVSFGTVGEVGAITPALSISSCIPIKNKIN